MWPCVFQGYKGLKTCMLCHEEQSRIFDEDFSDATSIGSTICNESSIEISEQDSEFSNMEEETEHTVDPYQFESVASNSDEDSYSSIQLQILHVE